MTAAGSLRDNNMNGSRKTLLLVAPAYRRGPGWVKHLGGVKQISQAFPGRVCLDEILIQAVAVQVPSGHAEVVCTHLGPVGLAGIHIAEIAESLGFQVGKAGIVLMVRTPVGNVVAIRIEDDI